MKQKIINYFQLDNYQITIKKELIGGLATFLAMAYILAVQPGMMVGYPVHLPFGGIYLATLLSAFVATLLIGLFARVPISLAPGMGTNAFFVYTVCGILQVNVYEALSAVLVSGWLYFFIALSPLRKLISNALPQNIKLAIGVAVGVFIGFVGLQQTGIIQSDASITSNNSSLVISPVSVKLGNLQNPLVLLAIFVFLYVDFFDTTGTFLVLDKTANLSSHDREQKWLKRANIVDATRTIFGASIGASTVTSYCESQVGIAQGARTGLATICTSGCFLLTIFLYPLMRPLMPVLNTTSQASVKPSTIAPIAGPALVVIRMLMVRPLRNFDWQVKLDIPVLFMTVLFTTLTYSIASGMSVGIMTYTTLHCFAGLKNFVYDQYKSRQNGQKNSCSWQSLFSKS